MGKNTKIVLGMKKVSITDIADPLRIDRENMKLKMIIKAMRLTALTACKNENLLGEYFDSKLSSVDMEMTIFFLINYRERFDYSITHRKAYNAYNQTQSWNFEYRKWYVYKTLRSKAYNSYNWTKSRKFKYRKGQDGQIIQPKSWSENELRKSHFQLYINRILMLGFVRCELSTVFLQLNDDVVVPVMCR